MMASLRQLKNSRRARPFCFMLPIIKPKHMENTTSPSAFTPLDEPGMGITSSKVSTSEMVPRAWVTFSMMLVKFSGTGIWVVATPAVALLLWRMVLVKTLVLYWVLYWKDTDYQMHSQAPVQMIRTHAGLLYALPVLKIPSLVLSPERSESS